MVRLVLLALFLPMLARTAHAEEHAPRFTIGATGTAEYATVIGLNLAASVRVAERIYVDGQVLVSGVQVHDGGGSPVDEPGADALGAQLGASFADWGRHGAGGVRASVGYLHMTHWEQEALISDEPFEVTFDKPYGELCGFGRLRLGPYVALELSLHARMYRDDGRTMPAFGAGAGVHVTLR